jgi:hypothetical protein
MNYKSKLKQKEISTTTKLFNWVACIGILTGILIVIAIIVIYLYPFRVTTQPGDYKVEPKQVKAGESLIYHAKYCKKYAIPAVVSRTFIDTFVYYMPETTTNFKKGCQTTDVVIRVPEVLPPGTYHIAIKRTYHILFRTIVEEVNTENFEIIK